MASSSESDVGIKGKMSEYEKQRFARIAENKARFEALGISKSAKALLGSSIKRRGKRNSGKDDDDYRPEEESEYDDEDDDFLSKSKSKASASKSKLLSKKNLIRSDEDSDDDLDKAIALSLQGSVAGGSGSTPTKKKRNDEEAGGRFKKKKTEPMSRTQMTEDELVIYFYHFDESGKGFITMRDVAKMAMLHDFTWIDEELQDMIRCFDMDKDEKLSLDDFKKIATRCRMLKES